MIHATPQIGGERSPLIVSRRQMLGGIGGAGALLIPAAGAAQTVPLTRRGTPQLTIGPFYPLDRPPEEDADLTRMAGRPGQAQGTIIEVSGKVLTDAGQPLPGAVLDMWQTNGLGRYHHPSDEIGLPYDPNFQGAAILRTDAEGGYWIRTVMPMPYERRQRHIHFDVRGRRRRLITQMFFPREPNQLDPLYSGLRNTTLEEAVTARRLDDADGVKRFTWNIRLAGE